MIAKVRRLIKSTQATAIEVHLSLTKLWKRRNGPVESSATSGAISARMIHRPATLVAKTIHLPDSGDTFKSHTFIMTIRMVIGVDGMVRTTALNTVVRIMAKITAVRILVKNTAVSIIAGEVADVVEVVDAVVAGAVGHGGHREVDRTGRTTITSHDRT